MPDRQSSANIFFFAMNGGSEKRRCNSHVRVVVFILAFSLKKYLFYVQADSDSNSDWYPASRWPSKTKSNPKRPVELRKTST